VDLRQIQYFLSLFEEQSVTRAARRLNIVQPALSMQIAKLERDIGKPLFTRTPRRMIPTPAGEEMYRLFLPIMTEFGRARERLMHSGDALSGHVRLGLVPSIGQHVLPDVLERFVERHPEVTLSISEGLTDHLIEQVAGGQLDLCYTNRSDRVRPVATDVVLRERIVFVTGINDIPYPPKVSLVELTGCRFVLPTRENGMRHIVEQALEADDGHLAPAIEVDSILTSARLIEKSLYVSLMPESIVRGLRSRYNFALRTYELKNKGFERQIVCSHNLRRPMTKAAQAFHDALASRLVAEHGLDHRKRQEERRIADRS